MADITRFRPEFHAACNRLIASSLTEAYEPEVIVNIAREWPERSFVALSAGVVVGYLAAMRRPDGWTRILMFAVSEPLRGRGIGSKLFDAVTARAIMDRDAGISLELREGNDRALAFYRQRGFRAGERIDRFYQNGDAAILMKRSFR